MPSDDEDPRKEEDEKKDDAGEDDRGSVTPREAKEMRERKAGKFFTTDASIETAIENATKLMEDGAKKDHGGVTYIFFKTHENREFLRAMRQINRHIASAQTLFDSEITLENSTPKFENYQNLFYDLLEEHIVNHSKTVFFEEHVKDGNYPYDYHNINTKLTELSMLLSRVQGTLSTAGEYIQDEPPAQSSNSNTASAATGNTSGYPAYPLTNTWQDRGQPDTPKERRDIGDGRGP